MSRIDKNNKLKDSPFSYKLTKNNKILVFYNNKQVKIINSKDSEHFINKIKNKTEFEIQLELAKITGNFKRGNEKLFKEKN